MYLEEEIKYTKINVFIVFKARYVRWYIINVVRSIGVKHAVIVQLDWINIE